MVQEFTQSFIIGYRGDFSGDTQKLKLWALSAPPSGLLRVNRCRLPPHQWPNSVKGQRLGGGSSYQGNAQFVWGTDFYFDNLPFYTIFLIIKLICLIEMKFVHINLSIFLKTLFIAYFLYGVQLTGSLSFCLILFSPNTCFSISTNDVDVFF